MAEENIKQIEKTEEKKLETKKENQPKIKKKYAILKAKDLQISTKDALHICDMIRNKDIESAEKMILEVIAFKRPVKMTAREFPHQHGKGIAGASYPIKAAEEFSRLLKNLKANAVFNELDIEKYILSCKADKASKPYRRGGRRFKRTHLLLKLVENKIRGDKK